MPIRRRIVLIGIALALSAVAGGGGWLGFQRLLRQPGPLGASRALVVPRGSAAQVAVALRDAGVILHARVFRAAAWLSRSQGSLHAAELEFPAQASVLQVLAVLRTGKPVEHRLTIPEGLTARQIAALLARADAATGEVHTPPEGSVRPQTYEYEYGTPRSTILARASAAMDSALAVAWADRAPNLPLASPREALILASIVERETAKPEERPRVAAVYLNRLRRGMRLEADPTVAYAANNGAGPLEHPLTRSDLERDDPFNTYRRAGLPPTPIDSPGMPSILAVLHPAASDDLYFVADGTGGHAFARSLETHARNVARWRSLGAPVPNGHGSPD